MRGGMSRFILLGMVDERAKPPAEWLRHLHEVGQWERLIELGKQSLGVDPLEASVHRHLAWAYGKTGRFAQMRPHVEFLLGSDPGEPANGHVAAIYCLEIRQLDQARRHIDDLLKHDPENANYHYLACIHSLRRHDIPAAERSIRQARALAPHWAAAAHLEVKISAIHHTKARQAWQRIRQLEEALALDPEDDAILASIGDVHLHELEQPTRRNSSTETPWRLIPWMRTTRRSFWRQGAPAACSTAPSHCLSVRAGDSGKGFPMGASTRSGSCLESSRWAYSSAGWW